MGQYTTLTRSFPRQLGHYREGPLGQTGITSADMPLVSAVADPKQTTYSYRTSPTLSEQSSLSPSDAQVTRNGFTTFDPVYDKGHEFWTTKQTIDLVAPSVYYTVDTPRNGRYFYRGPLVPTQSLLQYPTITGWTQQDTEMQGFGSRAIKATQPLKPNASAGQFIGELFEGLPSLAGLALLKERAHVLRGAGGEYLNVQFGWLPFISDLRKFATALRRATSILTQLERDNGRVVRRRFAFPSQVQTSSISDLNPSTSGVYSGGFGPYWGYLRSPKPTQTFVRTETNVWFSGAYSYAIPTDNSLLSRMQEFSAKSNVLFGARIDPSVVWELAPWSWLVDWKFGVGNLIANAGSFADDGLVIRYGYLMRHKRVSLQYQSQPQVTNTGYEIPAAFLTVTTDLKERLRATPYGFGVSSSAFSDTQWTILGALGMTKGPRSLW